MSLPLDTKAKLAKVFGFSKTGPTHVSDNRVVSDGYKIEDVESRMNIDAIQIYLGVESTDFSQLWDDMLAKVEGRIAEVPVSVPTATAVETITVSSAPTPQTPRKRGRPSKSRA